MREGRGPAFVEHLWSFVGGSPLVGRMDAMGEVPGRDGRVPARCPIPKQRGFRFVGPTVCYAAVQSAAIVNDHITSCFRWSESQASR